VEPANSRGRVVVLSAALVAVMALAAGISWFGESSEQVSAPVQPVRPRPSNVDVSWPDTSLLQPDRRFTVSLFLLKAYPAIGDADPKAPAAKWDGKAWKVDLGGEVVDVAALPTGQQLAELLASRAPKPKGEGAVDVTDALRKFHAPHLLEALQALDAKWSDSPEDRVSAASVLSHLLLQASDTTELSDPLAARALTAIALARASSSEPPRPLVEAEVLAYYALGYFGHAARLADGLPAGEPLRLFAEGDLDALVRAAVAAPTARNQYLVLRRAADDDDAKAWLDFVTEQMDGRLPSAAALATGTLQVPFGIRASLQKVIRAKIVAELGGRIESVALDAADATAGTPEKLAKAVAGQAGESKVWASPGLVRGLAEGAFYSSVQREFEHAADALSHPPTARAVVESLGATGGAYHEVTRALLTARGGGVGDAVALRALATADGPATAGTRLAALQALGPAAGFAAPTALATTRDMMRHVDTRPSHRRTFAVWLFEHAWDLPAFDRLATSLRKIAPKEDIVLQADNARRNGDLETLVKLMSSLSADDERLGHIVADYAAVPDADHDVVIRQFDRAMQGSPDNWRVRSAYTDYLSKRGDFEAALKVVEDWRGRVEGTRFEALYAASRAARYLRKVGRSDEALATITPKLSSGQAGVLAEAAMARASTGDDAGAEELFMASLERYPTTIHLWRAYLTFLWERGRYDDAAAQLAKAPRQPYDWAEYGLALCDVFAGRSVSELERALAPLAATPQPGHVVTELARGFGDMKLHAHAAQILTQVTVAGTEVIRVRALAYPHLVETQGEKKARAWLRQAVSAAPPPWQALVMFEAGIEDPLWEDLPAVQPGEMSHSVWTLRAGLTLASEKPDPERVEQMEQYFASADDTFYARVGKMLLGNVDPGELEDEAAANQRVTLEFWAGFRAQLEGDYETASSRYHAALLTNHATAREYSWATWNLRSWVSPGTTVERLKRERTPPLPSPRRESQEAP